MSGIMLNLVGNSLPPTGPPVVTGGTLTSDATYYYRTFTASGTLGVSNASISLDMLIIAGGGAGASIDAGTNNAQGAGGAGGYLSVVSQSLSPSNYSVVVGAGGAVSMAYPPGPTNGVDSSLASQTAVGGGAGAQYNTATGNVGVDGGSGGGGRVANPGGLGTAGQGNDGGTGGNQGGGGGGGGAGGVGGSRTTNEVNGGTGGAGSNANSSWASVTGTGVGGYYAGGGGGGSADTGTGGTASAGGGAGATYNTGPATSGTVNTGGGGGGAGGTGGTTRLGGAGGSGIVIVRYLKTAV